MSSRKLPALLLAASYFIVVVLPHEEVGLLVEKYLDKPLGRQNYNLLIIILAVALLLAIGVWAGRRMGDLAEAERNRLLSLLVFNLACIALTKYTLMVINIELIHVIQYGLMALFLFPVLMNYREVLFWSTLCGAFDEWYQYVILAPAKNDYYDFNDVIINMLGAALALLLIRIAGIRSTRFYARFRAPSFWTAALLLVLIVIGLLAGIIAIEPTEKDVVFAFIKQYDPGFWHELPKAYRFHIVRPLEGFVIICVLFLIFNNTDRQIVGDSAA